MLKLIAEVDRRKLYAHYASPSCFDFAIRYLHFSEGAAYKRIHAARAARRYPVIFDFVESGKLHLSGLSVLVPHLTDENHQQLLDEAGEKSKREIEALIAQRFGKVTSSKKDSLRKLPVRTPPATPSVPAAPSLLDDSAHQAKQASSTKPTNHRQLNSQTVNTPQSAVGNSPKASPTVSPKPVSLPQPQSQASEHPSEAPSRYVLQVTLSEKQAEKLQQAQQLLAAPVSNGTYADVLEKALDVLIAAELKRQYGIGAKRSTPRHNVSPKKKSHHQPTSPLPNGGHSSEPVKKQLLSSQPTCAGESSKNLTADTTPPMTVDGSNSKKKQSRYIPLALRRAVFEKDQGQCSFVDALGHRCPCRSRLQLHHRHPFAKGGKHTLENLELRCHAHNQHAADLDFGATLMEKHRKHSVKPNAQQNVAAVDGIIPNST